MTGPEVARESSSAAVLIGLGVIGGTVSGLFGVGGGIVFVPLMVLALHFTQRKAHATSLLAIVPTALVGALSFTIAGEVSWGPAALLAVGAVAGSRIGAGWLRAIDDRPLRLVFLGLLVAVGIRFAIEAFGGTSDAAGAIALDSGLEALAFLGIGVMVGALAALLGVGGGIVIVPVLVGLFGAGQIEAQATSLAAMIVPSSSAVYWHSRSGLVEWREGIRLGLGGAAGAVAGSRLALVLPERMVQIGFGALLLFVLVRMGRSVLGSR